MSRLGLGLIAMAVMLGERSDPAAFPGEAFPIVTN
jgi:hypothetical protein